MCTAAGLLVLGPIAAVALWDHLDTERRIRREWRDRHGGFEVAQPLAAPLAQPDPDEDDSRGP